MTLAGKLAVDHRRRRQRRAAPWTRWSQIDLSRGKIVYLSDLKPESVAYTPYFGLDKELPARREFFRLRAGPEPGIEAAAAGRQAVPQGPGPAQPHGGRLLSARPLPPLRGRGGHRRRGPAARHVRLVIRGDDKLLWEATLTGADKEPPQPIDLDVTGVRRLTILADFGGDLDVADHVVLGNARVSK